MDTKVLQKLGFTFEEIQHMWVSLDAFEKTGISYTQEQVDAYIREHALSKMKEYV